MDVPGIGNCAVLIIGPVTLLSVLVPFTGFFPIIGVVKLLSVLVPGCGVLVVFVALPIIGVVRAKDKIISSKRFNAKFTYE